MAENIRLKLRLSIFAVLSLACLLAIPILFQNCSAPIEGEGDVASVAANAPFAYETKMTHLAYMSCVNGATRENGGNNFFTFKLGAYGENSGIKLSPGFVNAARNLTVGDKSRALNESALNGGVHLSLNVRKVNDYQVLYNTNKFSSPYIGPLSTATNASELTRVNGKYYLSTFPTFSIDSRSAGGRVADSLYFTQDETTAANLRKDVTVFASGGSLLAATFLQSENLPSSPAISPPGADPKTSVFGRGFVFAFTPGFRTDSTFSPFSDISASDSVGDRRLSAMGEISLETKTEPSIAWICPANLSFVIYRQLDASSVTSLCPDDIPNTTDTATRDALRAMLPGWTINLTKRCAVPPANTYCYGTNKAQEDAVLVDYGTADASCSATTNTNACPHYVTICKRP